MRHITFVAIVAVGILTSLPAYAAFDTNLRYGSRGEAVKEVQQFLAEEGLYTGPVSGSYLSMTRKAVITFQKREGLPAFGIWGAMTRARVNELVVSGEEAETSTTVSAPAAQTTKDVCDNIAGVQASVPVGMSSGFGWCWTPVVAPAPIALIPAVTDVCGNIEGVQTSIPFGMHKDGELCRAETIVSVMPVATKPSIDSFVAVQDGESLKVSWSASNATVCVLTNPGDVVNIPFIGNLPVETATITGAQLKSAGIKSYVLTCADKDWNTTKAETSVTYKRTWVSNLGTGIRGNGGDQRSFVVYGFNLTNPDVVGATLTVKMTDTVDGNRYYRSHIVTANETGLEFVFENVVRQRPYDFEATLSSELVNGTVVSNNKVTD